jgi:hypothetical protein
MRARTSSSRVDAGIDTSADAPTDAFADGSGCSCDVDSERREKRGTVGGKSAIGNGTAGNDTHRRFRGATAAAVINNAGEFAGTTGAESIFASVNGSSLADADASVSASIESVVVVVVEDDIIDDVDDENETTDRIRVAASGATECMRGFTSIGDVGANCTALVSVAIVDTSPDVTKNDEATLEYVKSDDAGDNGTVGMLAADSDEIDSTCGGAEPKFSATDRARACRRASRARCRR